MCTVENAKNSYNNTVEQTKALDGQLKSYGIDAKEVAKEAGLWCWEGSKTLFGMIYTGSKQLVKEIQKPEIQKP